jgi:tetratricopeptide (TPR) repeat protein
MPPTNYMVAERPEAQLNLGTLYADHGRYREAELAYRKGIKSQPKLVPAYVNMAHLLSGRKREQEADGCLRRGLELNPESGTFGTPSVSLSFARKSSTRR